MPGIWFGLYVVLAIASRKTMHWEVHPENAGLQS
jgi:hypothetical protein